MNKREFITTVNEKFKGREVTLRKGMALDMERDALAILLGIGKLPCIYPHALLEGVTYTLQGVAPSYVDFITSNGEDLNEDVTLAFINETGFGVNIPKDKALYTAEAVTDRVYEEGLLPVPGIALDIDFLKEVL